jgi:hypothetical protein
MKHWKVPSLLAEALKELRANLEEDFGKFWPAADDREIHEDNMLLHLGAILKRKNAHIYAQVSTNDHPRTRVDFVAFPQQKDWFLICEAKRGYGKNHITGISRDIERIWAMAKDQQFQKPGQKHRKYSKAYGLILITCWSTPGGRALIKIWDNRQLTNVSHMDKACRDLKRKLDNLSAKRCKLPIQKYRKQEHYLLSAVIEINLD